MARIMVALKDNEIVTIDDVERGLACDCVCINCKARLIARKGDEREHHFAHHDSHETMACYENAFRVATKKALSEAGEIKLPINRRTAENKIISDVFSFKYDSVKILDSVKKSGKGLEILVELKNEKDVQIDVLICTSNKSRKKLEREAFRENISRIRINLINFQALTFDEFRKFLADDTLSKEWIYNKKASNKIKELTSNEEFDNKKKAIASTNNQIKNIRNTSNTRNVLYESNVKVDNVVSNLAKGVETASNQRSSEEYKKMGKEYWEANFKGKR